MKIKLAVESDKNGNGSPVFIDTRQGKNYQTGNTYDEVMILTPNGCAYMSYDQWRSMIALGLSMHMQNNEGENNG